MNQGTIRRINILAPMNPAPAPDEAVVGGEDSERRGVDLRDVKKLLKEVNECNAKTATQSLKKFNEELAKCKQLSEEATFDTLDICLGILEKFYTRESVEQQVAMEILPMLVALAEKGTPGPLFTRACSIISSIQLEEYNDDILSLSNLTTNSQSIPAPLSSNDDGHGDHDDANTRFHKHVKFILLFELMLNVLPRIHTSACVDYISLAVSSLLTVCSTIDTYLGASVCVRRVFVFARDFHMDVSQASEADLKLIRCILGCFISKAIALCMSQVYVKWSRRLFYELVNGLVDKPFSQRGDAFHYGLYTSRLWEALCRLSQVPYTFDYSPSEVIEAMIAKDYGSVELVKVFEQQRQDNTDPLFKTLCTPNVPGLYMLKTHLHCTGKRDPIPLSKVITEISFVRKFSSLTMGFLDSILYWSLWAITSLDEKQVHDCDPQLLDAHIRLLFSISEVAEYSEDRSIALFVIAKILNYRDLSVSLALLFDEVRDQKERSIKILVIQLIQSLITEKQAGTRVLRKELTDGHIDLLFAELMPDAEKSFSLMDSGDVGDVNVSISWLRLFRNLPGHSEEKGSLVKLAKTALRRHSSLYAEATIKALNHELAILTSTPEYK